MDAIHLALRYQRLASKETQANTASVSLTACLTFQANALMNRPGEGRAESDILHVCLPHRQGEVEDEDGDDDEDDDGEHNTVAYNPYGLFFYAKLCLPPNTDCPRLATGRVLKNESIRYFFKMDYTEIQEHLEPVGVRRKVQVPPTRYPNKRRKTLKLWEGEGEGEAETLFDLESKGFKMPASGYDNGEDRHAYAPGDLSEDASLDRTCTSIWKAFITDVLQKSPNPVGERHPSYMTMNMNERMRGNSEPFKSLHLSHMFRRVRIQTCDRTTWYNHFDRLFPAKTAPLLCSTTQGYLTSNWWPKHNRLIRKLDRPAADAYRARFRVLFDELKWVPSTACDRVWQSNSKKGKIVYPKGYTGSAPVIALNTSANPEEIAWDRDD